MPVILDDLNAATLSPELTDALQRFDDDAQIVCAAATGRPTSATDVAPHARATRAYRDALSNAAGRPDDPSWVAFVRATAALIAQTPDRSDPLVAAAIARLRLLIEENADLLG